MRLMLITADPAIARFAVASGIDRIFVDLETLGKYARQGHLDTHMAAHSIDDVATVREAVADAELLVRVNPLYEESRSEIHAAIQAGADVIMLPMFTSQEEVSRFLDIVDGRTKTCLLLETPQALARVHDVLELSSEIDEIHVGLNDLHLGMELDFMFELVSGGIVEYLSRAIRSTGVRFGFGGIARVGEGAVPADLILGEHVRLGSEMVILSRSFHGRAPDIEKLQASIDLPREIARIRAVEETFQSATADELEENRRLLKAAVRRVVEQNTRGV